MVLAQIIRQLYCTTPEVDEFSPPIITKSLCSSLLRYGPIFIIPTKMKKSPSRMESDFRTIFEDATAISGFFFYGWSNSLLTVFLVQQSDGGGGGQNKHSFSRRSPHRVTLWIPTNYQLPPQLFHVVSSTKRTDDAGLSTPGKDERKTVKSDWELISETSHSSLCLPLLCAGSREPPARSSSVQLKSRQINRVESTDTEPHHINKFRQINKLGFTLFISR